MEPLLGINNIYNKCWFVVGAIVCVCSGWVFAADGLIPADQGWDASVSPTELAYEFTIDDPEAYCFERYQSLLPNLYSWYTYVGFVLEDEKNGRCLLDTHSWQGIIIFARVHYRSHCPHGTHPIYSPDHNSDGYYSYGTSEYEIGSSQNLWVPMTDDPALMCMEPVKDKICASEMQASGTSSGHPLVAEETVSVNNPINCTSGLKSQIEVDYRSAGPDPLIFKRTYQSHSLRNGELNGHWYSIEDVRLDHLNEIPGMRSEYLRVSYSNGNVVHYSPVGDLWLPALASQGSIEQVDQTYELTTRSGHKFIFDEAGVLQQEVARSGEITVYTREESGAAQGKINSITNHYGTTLQFQYDSEGRLSAMIDPEGHVYQYGYDSEGRLSTVTYPDGTPLDTTDNPVKTYLYEDPVYRRALTGIIDENGNRYASYAYASGAAVSTEHAGGAQKATLNYLNIITTEVTYTVDDGLEHQKIYHYTNLNGADKLTWVDRKTCETCAVETQEWTYDGNGLKTSFKDWNEVETLFTHNSRGLETSRTEANGTTEARSITTEWHPDFALPVRIIEPHKTTEFNYDTAGRLLSRQERTVE